MDERIYMLNALWFKTEGGREKYGEYMRAVATLVEKYGGRPQLPGYVPDKAIIGEFDADLVFFVQWPSWKVFLQFAEDPEYESVRPLREAAITKSLLVRCQAEPGG